MKEKELKRCYDMFTSAWRFFKKYAVVEYKDNDEFWEKAVSESSAISKQYGECKLIIHLVSAAIIELERQTKELGLRNSEEVRDDNKYGTDE